MDWQPIRTATPMDYDDAPRLLVWVANGGMDGKGCYAFGHVFGTPENPRPRAEGFNGNWNITHWAPLDPPAS